MEYKCWSPRYYLIIATLDHRLVLDLWDFYHIEMMTPFSLKLFESQWKYLKQSEYKALHDVLGVSRSKEAFEKLTLLNSEAIGLHSSKIWVKALWWAADHDLTN